MVEYNSHLISDVCIPGTCSGTDYILLIRNGTLAYLLFLPWGYHVILLHIHLVCPLQLSRKIQGKYGIMSCIVLGIFPDWLLMGFPPNCLTLVLNIISYTLLCRIFVWVTPWPTLVNWPWECGVMVTQFEYEIGFVFLHFFHRRVLVKVFGWI